MKQKATKPVIRFEGFTDDWEQQKLKNMLEKVIDNRGKTPPVDSKGEYPMLEVASLGGFYPDYSKVSKYVNKETFNMWFRSYLSEGDILFSTVGNTGLTSLMNDKLNAVIAQNIIGMRFKNGYNSFFMNQLFKNLDNIKKVKRIEMGAVQPSVKVSQLIYLNYYIPSYPEQQKIGMFLKQLDDTIALHQRQLEALEKTKKSFLQKMFPKKDETKPEIRFAGFTVDWEQRKLGDITKKIGSGKTPKGGNSTYLNAGVPLIRSQNIFGNRLDFNDIAYISKDINNEMKNSQVNENDVLLNITGASIGRSAVYREKFTANVNQHVCIIRPEKDYSSDFIQLNLSSYKGQKEVELNQAGGGREGLNFKQISKMSFYYPNFEEQKKIGTFFKQLDDTIALHQRQLAALEKTKKSFLQKMFI